MYSLFISFAVLIVGCFVYGKVVEKVLRRTPVRHLRLQSMTESTVCQ